MAGDFSKRLQSENKHLSNITSSRGVHIDGTITTIPVRPGPGRVMWVTILTKGLAFTIRDGTKILGNVATGTPEGTYWLGLYCNTNININGVSGTGSANLSFDE